MKFKKIKFLKRIIALMLVLILCVESYAAIVSDNDGSAFITKAEFDSLKNNFQTQIDQYNTSIDAKIDGAIAAYLAGIRMSKKTDVPVTVSNYNEMLWKRKFDFYGGYADYTSATSKTVTSDVWFVPHFQEFLSFRGELHDMMIQWNRWYAGVQLGIKYRLSWPHMHDQAFTYSDPHNPGMNVPWTNLIACNYNYVDEVVMGSINGYDYLVQSSGMDQYHGSNPIVGSGSARWNESTSSWDGNTNNYYSLAPILSTDTKFPLFENVDVSDIEDGVFGCNIYCNWGNSRTRWARLSSKLSIKELNPAYCVLKNIWEDSKRTMVQNPVNIDPVAPDTFTQLGGHLYNDYIQSGYGQTDKMPYIMFGDDNELEVNIIRQSDVNVGRTPQTRTTYSKWASIPCTVTGIWVGGTWPWTLDENWNRQGLESEGMTFNLKYPYFERYMLKNITSAKFKNNGANLKCGEGLPISTYLNGNGTLTISFDYSIGRTAQTVPSGEDKRIKVDVKKSNFLSGSNDYYTGMVDGATTAVELKNAASGSNTSQKSKIVIENVKEGDEVWIRIVPYSTTSGLYAQMSNLTSSVESED